MSEVHIQDCVCDKIKFQTPEFSVQDAFNVRHSVYSIPETFFSCINLIIFNKLPYNHTVYVYVHNYIYT